MSMSRMTGRAVTSAGTVTDFEKTERNQATSLPNPVSHGLAKFQPSRLHAHTFCLCKIIAFYCLCKASLGVLKENRVQSCSGITHTHR